MALEWAKLSHCKRKKVGALIVKNKMIISDGYNGTPSKFENCCEDDSGATKWYVLHAEANAILKTASSTHNCNGSTLYLTMSLSEPICRSVSTLILTPQYENIASVTIVTKSISSIFLLNIKGAGL